jgi:Phage major capsid protein E
MASSALDYLRDLRIDEIMEDMQDVRVLPGKLTFLDRLEEVPAANSQLIAKHQGRVQIAPMIAVGAKAPVYKSQRFTVESNTLGKIKYGTHFSEDEMEEWLDLLENPIKDPEGILAGGMIRNTVKTQLLGIRQQMEWLAVAMALDGQLGTSSYSRVGYFLEGVTWGRYADLKATVAIPWQANPTTATPINDILSMKQLRKEKYGRNTNRVTMGTSTFRAVINTTEYQNKARQFLAPNVSYINIPLVNNQQNRDILGLVLEGMELDLYDGRYWNEDDSGTWSNQRFFPNIPTAPVVLDDSTDDGDPTVQDFGIGMPMESRMGSIGAPEGNSMIIGGPSGAVNRAISYAAVPPSMDPVGLTIFSAMKCFPRLYQRDSNAVLYVGPVTDTYPAGGDLSPV